MDEARPTADELRDAGGALENMITADCGRAKEKPRAPRAPPLHVRWRFMTASRLRATKLPSERTASSRPPMCAFGRAACALWMSGTAARPKSCTPTNPSSRQLRLSTVRISLRV